MTTQFVGSDFYIEDEDEAHVLVTFAGTLCFANRDQAQKMLWQLEPFMGKIFLESFKEWKSIEGSGKGLPH